MIVKIFEYRPHEERHARYVVDMIVRIYLNIDVRIFEHRPHGERQVREMAVSY